MLAYSWDYVTRPSSLTCMYRTEGLGMAKTNKETDVYLQNQADNPSRELDPVSPPSGVKT